jgi:uncharacterized protein YciI
MQFIVTGYDGSDVQALDRRMAVREAHIRAGDQMRDRGELLYAVALLNDEDKMTGSVCIVEFPSRAELDQWLNVEPYVTGKVWQKIEIRPCRVGPSFAKSKSLSR